MSTPLVIQSLKEDPGLKSAQVPLWSSWNAFTFQFNSFSPLKPPAQAQSPLKSMVAFRITLANVCVREGDHLSWISPWPSWPLVPRPQLYTFPAIVMTTVWRHPHATCVTRCVHPPNKVQMNITNFQRVVYNVIVTPSGGWCNFHVIYALLLRKNLLCDSIMWHTI